MHIKKKTSGGHGDHSWPKGGDVIEVPDRIGADLIRLAPDEYSEASPSRRAKHSDRLIEEQTSLDAE